jgi:hypothetical protein
LVQDFDEEFGLVVAAGEAGLVEGEEGEVGVLVLERAEREWLQAGLFEIGQKTAKLTSLMGSVMY